MLLNILIRIGLVVGRSFGIDPRGEVILKEEVTDGQMFKLMLNYSGKCLIQVYDPSNKLIWKTEDKRFNMFSSVNVDKNRLIKSPAFVKVVITNLSPELTTDIYYKMPCAADERVGYTGVVKEKDYTLALVDNLKKLIKQQYLYIANINKGQENAKFLKIWFYLVMIIEVSLSTLFVYYIHRNFIDTFESKQTN